MANPSQRAKNGRAGSRAPAPAAPVYGQAPPRPAPPTSRPAPLEGEGLAAVPRLEPTLPEGMRLGAFEIKGVITQSRAAVIYRVADHSLGVPAAIKEYMPVGVARRGRNYQVEPIEAWHEDTIDLGRRAFFSESRALARCDDPSLLRVTQLWEINGTAYRVMPLYSGKRLVDLRRDMKGPIDEVALRAILQRLLDALGAYHASAGVHGNVTPANILMPALDRPVLLGPGKTGTLLATELGEPARNDFEMAFAAPEHHDAADAPPIGVSADLFGVAQTLRYCITGSPPLGHESLRAAIHRMLGAGAVSGFSDALLDMLTVATSPVPSERPQSIEDFRLRLRRLEAQGAAAAAPPQPAASSSSSAANAAAAREPVAFAGRTPAASATPQRMPSPGAAAAAAGAVPSSSFLHAAASVSEAPTLIHPAYAPTMLSPRVASPNARPDAAEPVTAAAQATPTATTTPTPSATPTPPPAPATPSTPAAEQQGTASAEAQMASERNANVGDAGIGDDEIDETIDVSSVLGDLMDEPVVRRSRAPGAPQRRVEPTLDFAADQRPAAPHEHAAAEPPATPDIELDEDVAPPAAQLGRAPAFERAATAHTFADPQAVPAAGQMPAAPGDDGPPDAFLYSDPSGASPEAGHAGHEAAYGAPPGAGQADQAAGQDAADEFAHAFAQQAAQDFAHARGELPPFDTPREHAHEHAYERARENVREYVFGHSQGMPPAALSAKRPLLASPTLRLGALIVAVIAVAIVMILAVSGVWDPRGPQLALPPSASVDPRLTPPLAQDDAAPPPAATASDPFALPPPGAGTAAAARPTHEAPAKTSTGRGGSDRSASSRSAAAAAADKAAADKEAADQASHERGAGAEATSEAATDPSETCAGRTQFSFLRCMQAQCSRPRWASHPECIKLRRTEGLGQ